LRKEILVKLIRWNSLRNVNKTLVALNFEISVVVIVKIKAHIPINGEIDLSSLNERKFFFFLIKNFTV
jgi:hypothetical protein